jgi:hydrogenase maturation factor HypF (carbamoyltransferase family)
MNEFDICMKCKKKWNDHDDKEYHICVMKLTGWLGR